MAYVEAFRRWPEAAIFGGRIKPRYEAPVEKWVIESEPALGGPYAIRDFGEHAGHFLPMTKTISPMGRIGLFVPIEQRAFRYDPELGPIPKRIRNQEETEIIQRLLKSGATGYWIPEAMVEHCIGRDRQTVRYIAAYYESWGETLAFRNAAATAATPFWFGVPRRIWPRLLVWWVLYRFCRFVSPAPVWVKYLEHYSWNKGIFRYWKQTKVETHRKAKVDTGA